MALIERREYNGLMAAWLFKQFVPIIIRYVIALLVGMVVGSVAHFLIFNAISGSFLSKIMTLHIFVLMIPSVFAWHLIAQFSPIMRRYKRYVEIKSASITVVLVLVGIVVWLPELTSAATIDITLYVSTLTIAAGLFGFTMDWLKTKEWMLRRFIIT